MNIFIAEDEQIALDELKMMLRQYEDDHKIYAMKNGEEALRISKSIKPDLLITDIRMPGMDGLMLIRSLKALYPDMVTIILSGYDDFEYARAGLKLEAREYLLKPVRQQALIQAVESALKDIVNQQQQQKKLKEWSIVLALTGQEVDDSSVIPSEFGVIVSVPVNFESDVFWDLDASDAFVVPLGFPKGSIVIYPDLRKRCVFIPEPPEPHTLQLWANMVHEKLTHKPFSVHTTYALKTSELSNNEVYQQAIRKIKQQIRLETCTFTTPASSMAEPDYSRAWNKARLLEVQLSSRDRRLIRQEINAILTELQTVHATLSQIGQFLNDLFTAIVFKLTNGVTSKIITTDEMGSVLYSKTTIRDISDWIEEKIMNFVFQIETKDLDPKGLVQILMHKARHSDTEFPSLHQFAKDHHISMGYLSRLFKMETGITFSEYVLEIRMGRAKKLLEIERLSISEIGQQLGYEDSKYFSQIFKKWTGLTPSEYQKDRKNPPPKK